MWTFSLLAKNRHLGKPRCVRFDLSSRLTVGELKGKTLHEGPVAALYRSTTQVRVCDWYSQDPGFDPRRGCAVFFRLIRLFALLSLSELKEKRIGAVRIRHSIREIATHPVILWILLGGKPKWLQLNFGFNDVMRTTPIWNEWTWTAPIPESMFFIATLTSNSQ